MKEYLEIKRRAYLKHVKGFDGSLGTSNRHKKAHF